MFFPFAHFEYYLRSLVYTCGKNTGSGTVLGEIEVVCDCVATMNELRVFRRSHISFVAALFILSGVFIDEHIDFRYQKRSLDTTAERK